LISDFDVTPIKVDRARGSFNTQDLNNRNNELEIARQQMMLPIMGADHVFANNQSKFRNAS